MEESTDIKKIIQGYVIVALNNASLILAIDYILNLLKEFSLSKLFCVFVLCAFWFITVSILAISLSLIKREKDEY